MAQAQVDNMATEEVRVRQSIVDNIVELVRQRKAEKAPHLITEAIKAVGRKIARGEL